MRKNNNYLSDEEFEDFLHKIGGLTSGYKFVNEPIFSRKSFGIKNGWLGILQRLIETLIKLGWNKEFLLVKEKFGGMSVFLSNIPENSHHFIVEAEKESFCTCEICGEPGEQQRVKGWIHTLCDEHHKNKTIIEIDGKNYITDESAQINSGDQYFDARINQILTCDSDNFFDPWAIKVVMFDTNDVDN